MQHQRRKNLQKVPYHRKQAKDWNGEQLLRDEAEQGRVVDSQVFFICQAFVEEAVITKDYGLDKSFNLINSNDWAHFVEESGTNEYGTVLHWVGKELELNDKK